MRRPALFVPALFVSTLLSACAGGEAPSGLAPARHDLAEAPPAASPQGVEGAAARLARSPAVTAASGTARTRIVTTVTGLPGSPEPLVVGGQGAIDFAGGRSRSVLDLAGALGTTPGAASELETVVADGLLYVRAPALSFTSDTSTPWVRIDPRARGNPGDGDPGGQVALPGLAQLTGLAGSDLSAPIALLAGADPSSVRVTGGLEGHDGLTRLHATVDVLAATDRDDDQGDLADLERFLDDLGARRLEVDVELDEDDRLRRIVYEHRLPLPNGPVEQHFEVEYFDFGAPVEIDVPVDAGVVDLPRASLGQGPR